MNDLMNAKLFLKATCCEKQLINVVTLVKIILTKPFFTLPKNECTSLNTSYQPKKRALFYRTFFCSNHFKKACFVKNWTLQILLFYTLHPKKTKLIDGWLPTISPRKSEGTRCVFIVNTKWPILRSLKRSFHIPNSMVKTVGLVKSRDKTITQVLRKNKSILM